MSTLSKIKEFTYKQHQIKIMRKAAYSVGDMELVPAHYSFIIDGTDQTIRGSSTVEGAEMAAKMTVDEWLS